MSRWCIFGLCLRSSQLPSGRLPSPTRESTQSGCDTVEQENAPRSVKLPRSRRDQPRQGRA